MPRLYSAFRAWCTGIGNAPGSRLVGAGDQYLAMDQEPWHEPGLPETLGMWLTLNVPEERYEVVGDRLEAWMSAPVGRWHFVGRLSTFDRDLHGRPSYFAHGRGWRATEWTDPEFDPGVLLGDASAFDLPRLTPEAGQASRPPEPLDRLEVACDLLKVQQYAAATARLVAWLWEAIETGRAVVCFAPLEEFLVGSPLATLACIARAALPIEIRRRAKIRVYADTPQAFLEAGVHLLLLVRDHAAVIERFHPTVLEFCDGSIEGPRAAARHEEYADAVIQRARSYPRELLRFGATAGRRLRSAFRTEKGIGTSVEIAYDLAVAGSFEDAHDSLLRKRLFPEAVARSSTTLFWTELLDDADWSTFGTAALTHVAVSPAPSSDSAGLRSLARRALATRRICIDEDIERRWSPNADAGRDIINWCIGTSGHSLSFAMAGRLLRTLSPEDAAELLLDETCMVPFADLTAEQPLPDMWRVSSLLDPPPLTAGQMLLAVADSSHAPAWRQWIDHWVVAVARGEQVPQQVGEAAISVGASVADLNTAIAYGDVYTWHDPSGGHALRHMTSLRRRSLPPEERGILVDRCAQGTSEFLERHAPLAWLLDGLSAEEVILLVPFLDRRMTSRTADTVAALVRSGWWAQWARSSSSTELRYRATLEWLCDNHRGDQTTDWDEVTRALDGRLSGDDLTIVLQKGLRDACMRQMPLAKQAELAACAADLGACALLAEMRPRPAYQDVETIARQRTSLFDGLPDGVLRLVGTAGGLMPSLTLLEAESLIARSGCRRAHAVAACVNSMLSDAARGLLAAPAAASASLWDDVDVRRAITEWVEQHARRLEDRGAALMAWLPDHVAGPLHRVCGPAVVVRAGGRPEATSPTGPAGGSVTHAALTAMCAAAADDKTWSALAKECAYATRTMPHPLAEMAECVLRLDSDMRDRLSQFGWTALEQAIAKHPVLTDVPCGYGGALPVFVLLLRTGTDMKLHDVALRVINWRTRLKTKPQPEWFASLLRAMNHATRMSGARSADDSADAAIACLVADISRGSFPDGFREELLAQVNPLREVGRKGWDYRR